jgi:hypothetical protein
VNWPASRCKEAALISVVQVVRDAIGQKPLGSPVLMLDG